jgi:DNA polymerase-4
LHTLGIRKVGDLAKLDDAFLEQRFGKWGLALVGKSRGLDAGGWYDAEIGDNPGPKSISHEHTFNEDTADLAQLESTLARLSEMVGRRLREHNLLARTLQLKLRYSDFSTITRAHSLPRGTSIDTEIYREIHALFLANWNQGAPIRLLGVNASSWAEGDEQMDLLGEDTHERWRRTLAVADKMRDKFGESAVSLASGLRGAFREQTHENPAGLPGKDKQ